MRFAIRRRGLLRLSLFFLRRSYPDKGIPAFCQSPSSVAKLPVSGNVKTARPVGASFWVELIDVKRLIAFEVSNKPGEPFTVQTVDNTKILALDSDSFAAFRDQIIDCDNDATDKIIRLPLICGELDGVPVYVVGSGIADLTLSAVCC